MPKCDFNKVALQLYRNPTSAWVFPLYAAYFQNTFLQDHLWRATSEKGSTNAMNINKINTLKGSHIPGSPSIFWKVITTLYINIRINE